MRQLLILLFCFNSLVISAQNADSVEIYNQLKELGSTNERVEFLLGVIDTSWHSHTSLAIYLSREAFEILPAVENPVLKVNIISNIGIASYTLDLYDSAEHFYRHAINIAEDNDIQISQQYLMLASVLKRKGRFISVINYLDSLLKEWPKTHDMYNTAALSLADSYLEVGDLSLARGILNSPDKFKIDTAQAGFKKVKARQLALEGEYHKSSKLYKEAIRQFNNANDGFGKADAYMYLGENFMNYGKYDSARFALDEAANIYDSLGYRYGKAKVDYRLGALYIHLGDLALASEKLYDALRIYEKNENANELIEVYYDLGYINNLQNSEEEALNFINRSIELSEKSGNVIKEATAYNYKGLTYLRNNKLDEALDNFEKALDLRESIQYHRGIAAALYNMGLVYDKKGNEKAALNEFLRSYEIEKALGNTIGIAISENKLGDYYTKLERYGLAQEMLRMARKRLQNIDAKKIMVTNYLYTAQLYDKLGVTDQALQNYKKYISLKDTVEDMLRSEQVEEIRSRYELESKEREIDLLNLENQSREQQIALNAETIQNQRLIITIIVGGFILVLVAFILIIRLLRLRSKTAAKLKELNIDLSDKQEEIITQSEELREAHDQILVINEQLERKVEERTKQLSYAYHELDTFFYRSSHDFRGPITTFLGLAKLSEIITNDPQIHQIFHKVEHTANQLDKMVKKLQTVSIVSRQKLTLQRFSLKEVIDDVIDQYKDRIERENTQVQLNIRIETMFSDMEFIKAIVANVLENALNFSKGADLKIHIYAEMVGDNILLSVADNGIGIDKDLQDKVWQMYVRGTEFSRGNGLGLYIVNKAVHKLEGHCELISEVDKGTTVKIYLPVRGY